MSAANASLPLPRAARWGWLVVFAILLRLALPGLHDHSAHGHAAHGHAAHGHAAHGHRGALPHGHAPHSHAPHAHATALHLLQVGAGHRDARLDPRGAGRARLLAALQTRQQMAAAVPQQVPHVLPRCTCGHEGDLPVHASGDESSPGSCLACELDWSAPAGEPPPTELLRLPPAPRAELAALQSALITSAANERSRARAPPAASRRSGWS